MNEATAYMYVAELIFFSISSMDSLESVMNQEARDYLGFMVGPIGRVHIFREGHKILQNLHLTFAYSTYSQK